MMMAVPRVAAGWGRGRYCQRPCNGERKHGESLERHAGRTGSVSGFGLLPPSASAGTWLVGSERCRPCAAEPRPTDVVGAIQRVRGYEGEGLFELSQAWAC